MRKYFPFVFLTGVVLCAVGYFSEELSIVVNKAINICLECIGLG